MKSGFLFIVIAYATLAAAADKPQTQVQAQLLDSNQYLCSNCFFGATKYFYCFEADKKVLIGMQKVPVFNWKDPASNDLAYLHKSWKPFVAAGQTVPLRYDDKYIYVTRADGKTVRLKQNYNIDIFVNSAECRAAVKKTD